MPDSNLHSNYL